MVKMTPLKIQMEPENLLFEKGTIFQTTIIFGVPCSFSGVWNQTKYAPTKHFKFLDAVLSGGGDSLRPNAYCIYCLGGSTGIPSF